MSFGALDAKKKVLADLMQHLDKRDDEGLQGALKPKGIEVKEVKAIGGHGEPDGDEMPMGDDDKVPGMPEHDGMGGMKEEEIKELIEALEQKLGI